MINIHEEDDGTWYKFGPVKESRLGLFVRGVLFGLTIGFVAFAVVNC